MQFGVMIPHVGPLASPGYIRDFCQTAEEIGYTSLWTIGHLVAPPHADSVHTVGVEGSRPLPDNYLIDLLSPMYDMTSTLLWVAGFTKKVLLGTCVAILPIVNPIHNARILATLDVLSGGRLLYGVGIGWLKEEADAMQMPWDRRGKRSEEHIAVLRRIWGAEGRTVDFEGEFYRFGPMDPEPRPVQKLPPIIVGGHSDVALRRVGRIGDGWITSGMDAPEIARGFAKAKEYAREAGRDPDRLILVSRIDVPAATVSGKSPLAEPVKDIIRRVQAFKEAGVTHLRVVIHPRTSPQEPEALKFFAREVMPVFAGA